MNTWRNLPGKIRVTTASLDPRLRKRALAAAADLSPGERELFLSMGRYDLAHALAVSAKLAHDPLLRRAGLLHDAGKLRSEASLATRWLYTGMELLAPRLLRKTCGAVEAAARGGEVMERVRSLPRGWRRGIYVQVHHGEVAAALLKRLGSERELLDLVERHQMEPCGERERLLREADDSL